MSITAVIEKGLIKLPKDVQWPSGTVVRIEPVDEPSGVAASASPEKAFTLHEMALAFPTACDLPDDLAINHDYYLHGSSKQQPRRGRWIQSGKAELELTEQEAAEFTNKLLALAAETSNLPPDLSANHDHYLHGLTKR